MKAFNFQNCARKAETAATIQKDLTQICECFPHFRLVMNGQSGSIYLDDDNLMSFTNIHELVIELQVLADSISDFVVK